MAKARTKGHGFERDLCWEIPEALGIDARGLRGFQQFQGGKSGNPDVIPPKNPKNGKTLNRIWFEAKRVEKLNHKEAFNQAVDDCRGTGRIPALVYRYNRDVSKVTFRLSDLLEAALEIVEYAGYEVNAKESE